MEDISKDALFRVVELQEEYLVNHQLVAHCLVNQAVCLVTPLKICLQRKEMIQHSIIKVMEEKMNFIRMMTMKHRPSPLVRMLTNPATLSKKISKK